MASITLKNIKKTYDAKHTVIENLNLEIKDKEFMILVGPSGCGKSTTLRMIAGLEEISGGELLIGDRVVNDVAPKDRDIAMVFQSYALYPHMSVYKNMAFALKRKHEKQEEIDRKVHAAAKVLELEEYLNRKPRALSGGQRQRVALGRAMVRQPSVFLLDEPLSNLDAKLRAEMRTQLKKLHQDLQTTFVYVTHDQTEAMTMADRIVVMKDGVIQQVDTPQNLYNHPSNQFVAGFIGTPQMNFIDAKLAAESGRYFVCFDAYRIPLPDRMVKARDLADYTGQTVVLGVRPEDFHGEAEYRLKTQRNLIHLPVDQAEMMGAEIYLYGEIGKTPVVAKIPSAEPVAAGDTAALALDMQAAHLFDKRTGDAITD